MKVKPILKVLITLLLTVYEMENNDICDDGIIDTITELNNGSVIMFRKNQLWLLDKDKQLSGPKTISREYLVCSGKLPVSGDITSGSRDVISGFC
jgi:hypothetical protein